MSYTPLSMKINRRWRGLMWRVTNPTYGIFVASTILAVFAVRAFGTSYASSDTHRRRVEANGSYARRRFAEVNDNPIYRLPENPAGGHKLDGLSSQNKRRASLTHH